MIKAIGALMGVAVLGLTPNYANSTGIFDATEMAPQLHCETQGPITTCTVVINNDTGTIDI